MSRGIAPAHHVRFDVANVTPSTEPLPRVDLKSALDRAAKTKLLICPDANREVVRDADFHPLIAAAAFAFKQHYPLALSPDAIWLTVLQGVAQHIQNNAEHLRARLVHNQTKIELVVKTDLFSPPENDAQMLAVANAFTDQIARHVHPEKRSLFKAEFSTTSDADRIAASVVIMDAFQPYFDYVFTIICGIPSIILDGTVTDWQLLESKVQALHRSDLELSWWSEKILPLCNHFVRAAGGDVDSHHWNNLCKIMERYGADDLNGWILKFIPYVRKDRNERPVHRNPVLELTTYDEKPADSQESRFKITGCTSNMLPTGVSGVPVTCHNMDSGEDFELQFLAGFTGVEQSAEDLSLRALTGWAIAQPHTIDVLIKKLLTDSEYTKPEPLEISEMLKRFNGHLPGDMWKFYMEFDGVGLNLKEPNRWNETHCQIFGPRFIEPLWDAESVQLELDYLSSQGEISPNLFAERKQFSAAYAGLLRLAWASAPTGTAYYVFGALGQEKAGIYRWTGKPLPEAFTRVAESFTEWLGTLVDSTVEANPKR